MPSIDMTCPTCGGHRFFINRSHQWLREDEDHPERVHTFIDFMCECGHRFPCEINTGFCRGGSFPLVQINGRYYNAQDI